MMEEWTRLRPGKEQIRCCRILFGAAEFYLDWRIILILRSSEYVIGSGFRYDIIQKVYTPE